MKQITHKNSRYVGYISPRGVMYIAECNHCGISICAHEFFHFDFDERRHAMEQGTFRCVECSRGHAYGVQKSARKWYAGWTSMPGYLDCTEPVFGRNRRTVEREIRALLRGDY